MPGYETRSHDQMHTIGKPHKMQDGQEKVTGKTRFGTDLTLPGMLHMRLVLSPYAHARILSISRDAALAVPGVVAVLTSDDLPPRGRRPRSRAQAMLAHERVLFRGQPVVAVVAESEAAAEDGVDAVEVDYDVLDAVVDARLALEKGAPLVWPTGLPTESEELAAHGAAPTGDTDAPKEHTNIVSASHFKRGDVAEGFAEADVILERTYTTPRIYQAYLEPHVTVAAPDPLGNGLTVWTATQTIFGARRAVADIVGLPEEQVKVVGTTVGGAFGAKFAVFQPLCAAAALVLNRPVRLALTRSEDFLAATPAPESIFEIRVGAKRDGTLTALQARCIFDTGCFPNSPGSLAGLMLGGCYRFPHLAIEAVDVLTHKAAGGAYRGPGATQTTLTMEQHMDDLARELGMDGLELRLKNAMEEGDLLPNGQPLPSIGLRAVIQRMMEHPLWKERGQNGKARRGVGAAVGGWLSATEPAAAVCKMDRDGSLVLNLGMMDISGTNTTMSAIAAEVFGVPIDKVRIITGDTDSAPFAAGSGGSKITYTVGQAVQRAAQEARTVLLNVAAEKLEVHPDDLDVVNGHVQVRGVPERKISLKDIGNATMQFGGRYEPITGIGRSAQLERAPGYSGTLAEVEVDEGTGEVRVTRLVTVQDVGRAINPMAIEGQMHGGAVQGIGWSLYERMVYDESGQLLTGSLMDYAVPRAEQSPNLEAVIVEVPSPFGPFGARGVGEPAIIPPGAAIANAVRDAIGVRVPDLPITPEMVFDATHDGSV